MTTWYCRYRRSSSLLVALPLRSALSVFLAQCRPFSSVLCGIDTVTAVLGCATAENVEPLSDVNGWTDISDEEEIPRVLEKIRSFAEYISETPQRREEFLSLQPAGIGFLPLADANTRCEHPMKYEVFDAEARSQTTKFIDQYWHKSGNSQFRLSSTEWRKVEYLV
jgi:hypothetical protein